jgi:hypothetical protein
MGPQRRNLLRLITSFDPGAWFATCAAVREEVAPLLVSEFELLYAFSNGQLRGIF